MSIIKPPNECHQSMLQNMSYIKQILVLYMPIYIACIHIDIDIDIDIGFLRRIYADLDTVTVKL